MYRIIYSLHRILGSILSLLFLIWFLSGFVMIYHSFPKVKERDKYRAMLPLRPSMLPADSLLYALPSGETLLRLSLKTKATVPVLQVATAGQTYEIAAPDGCLSPALPATYEQIRSVAERWCQAGIRKVDTLYKPEQWIPFGRLRDEMPVYKFYFDDRQEHQLYVSSSTAEAIQFTDRNSRFWAWVGAIPHWIYFTELRQNSKRWSNVVICLSAAGTIMCISGIVAGIKSFVRGYRKGKRLKSPYRKPLYRWHHVAGFIFGVFVCTFIFSGMMSLARVPQWIAKEHNPSLKQIRTAPAPVLDPACYQLDCRRIFDCFAPEIKQIEWSSFGDIPLYKVVVNDRLITLNASGSECAELYLTETDLLNRFSKIHHEPVTVSLMEEFDNYYISRKMDSPLPVYKVEVSDADRSVYYVHPQTGSVRYFNTHLRIQKWCYRGLHAYSIKFLVERPVLWHIVMWTTMLGGTLVSLTGVWMGIRFVKRKLSGKRPNH
jgi:uncharacterized iron-regulated membrane protein